MIGFYLLPYPVRGFKAPYLWVFYKWLTVLKERAVLLVGADYLQNSRVFEAEGRWELKPASRHVLGYEPATSDCRAAHDIRCLPEPLFQNLMAACRDNPIELFRRMLTERLPLLEAEIDIALSSLDTTLEAIVTWCNCPSLSAVARARGIQVIHLEIGPLRAPLYRPTAYLDFSGVNGNTEAADRYARLPVVDRHFDAASLRRFFFLSELPPKDPVARIGLALQVEDDSNLVAFGRGYDNQAAVVYAHLKHSAEQITIRSHPGSVFSVRDSLWFEPDRSYDSLEFIQRCQRILTINSSIGLEALLLGTPVTALGDSSYGFILEADEADERLARLAFYLFAYLIPEPLQFDLDYLRFRLANPDETSIVACHLASYLGNGDSSVSGRSFWELIESGLVRANR